MPRASPAQAPPGMVLIPAGWFLFGEERQRVELEAFHIDRLPVTNREYALFGEATGARLPVYFQDAGFLQAKGEHPVVGISVFGAMAYALWAGKDLPTEEEWEKAARGTDGRRYPWGNYFDSDRCNTSASGIRDTLVVGRLSTGASPFGCLDMAGNTWEWSRTPAGAEGHLVSVKGGSWFDPPGVARLDRRFTARPDYCSSSLGFRCVWRAGAPFRPIPRSFRYAFAPRARRRPLGESPEEWRELLEGVGEAGGLLDEAGLGGLEEWNVKAALEAADRVLGSDEEDFRQAELEERLEAVEAAIGGGRLRHARELLDRYYSRGGDCPHARDLEIILCGREEEWTRPLQGAESGPGAGLVALGLILVNLLLFVFQWIL